MKKLTETFNTLSVTRREVFQIELPAMTSAGYKWSVEVQGEGALLSEQTQLPPGNALGGQVKQIFSIVAEKAGTISIVATYKRPWLDTVEKTQKFTVKVI